jgi:hypothetical protein
MHAAHKATFNGLYPRPCQEKILKALSPSTDQTRRVLDLGKSSVCSLAGVNATHIYTGSGSGAW